MSQQSEGTFKQRVVRELKEFYGEDIDILTTQERARKGVSDLVICLNGESIRLELKVDGERPTPLQQHRLNRHSKAGGYSFWSTPSRWPSQFETLKERHKKHA